MPTSKEGDQNDDGDNNSNRSDSGQSVCSNNVIILNNVIKLQANKQANKKNKILKKVSLLLLLHLRFQLFCSSFSSF